MELPISTGLYNISHSSSLYLLHYPSFLLLHSKRFHGRLNCNTKPLRVELSSEKDTNSISTEKCNNSNSYYNRDNSYYRSSNGKDSEFVEVIAIGSRKDAVLDFCLNSPLCSQALRFWNIILADSSKVQLQQRFLGKETARIVEPQSLFQSCSKAFILLVSTAYGPEHIAALDILKTIKSSDKLIVGIILKPFSFEGQRRQDEVKDIVNKLQKYTNFYIFIDTDALLEKHLVTLDEALKTVNNAVLMAINAIFVLISDMHMKLLDIPHHTMKEVKVPLPQLVKISESFRDARIGFGSGYNIKMAIMRAIYDCPFLDLGVKHFNGTIVCVLASSGVIKSSDVQMIIHTFRQTTEWAGEIILSVIDNPNLEPNQITASIITLGSCTRQNTSQKSSIFSRLARYFPFIFNILRKHQSESDNTCENNSSESSSPSELFSLLDAGNIPYKNSINGTSEDFDNNSVELQTLSSDNVDEIYLRRDNDFGSEQRENTISDYSPSYRENSEGASLLERKQLIGRNLGNGYQAAQEWANGGTNGFLSASILDSLSICRLPVGVKPSEDLKECPDAKSTTQNMEKKAEDDTKTKPVVTSSLSWDALTDMGLEAVIDFNNSTSMLSKGNYTNVSKQGILAMRAASMLEAERGSQKKWNPILEMKYRGGIYKGHCQGGLPEGKGRLSLADGSIYDGMWNYGKRSGLGTLYFNNDDVFQGSWRDDVMHGKGWFYFHTGDRWFVNFWKGKANGEGRFYSKVGDIFFGYFKDGWRDGQFIYINVNGTRYLEIWDEGILLSRKQLDPDASS